MSTSILVGDQVIPHGKFHGACLCDLLAADLRWIRRFEGIGPDLGAEIEVELRRRSAVRERRSLALREKKR